MSQFLNLLYDGEQKKNDSPNGDGSRENLPDNHNGIAIGPSRNICFVIDNTKRVFLNYSYLVCGEYKTDENEIILTFTTHSVKMNGVGLQKLFYQIMENEVRQVVVLDSRYNTLFENRININSIHIFKDQS